MSQKEPYAVVLLDGETIGMTRQEMWDLLAGLGPVRDGYNKYGKGRMQSIHLWPGKAHIYLGCLVMAVPGETLSGEDRWIFHLDRPEGGYVLDLAEVCAHVRQWRAAA